MRKVSIYFVYYLPPQREKSAENFTILPQDGDFKTNYPCLLNQLNNLNCFVLKAILFDDIHHHGYFIQTLYLYTKIVEISPYGDIRPLLNHASEID